ncbi:MAG: hypothetical protein CMI56_03100 [Parcubacteria group bacterium]|nr:hypothetical protein [Parcubacteria group bacterium]|tara:strand:- start:17 stop:199 length:183 start_codon:yes stop_codon:yes gene_type:complete
MNGFFHKSAMALILIGGIILFYLASVWFLRGNIIMTIGMVAMGMTALANFYLHKKAMVKK